MQVKKTIQKKKNSKINSELVSDFKKAYADGIVSICRYLTHSGSILFLL